VDWTREMKRYGILPKDWPPSSPIDVYGTEKQYWASLRYVPPGE